LRRPPGMMLIHNEGVGVAACALQMRMIERKIVVGVLQGLCVILWPEPEGGQEAYAGQRGKHPKCYDGA
ncbi:hypothetical protein PHISP_08673, partial [Aspergillus sp. HF37]